jgi:MFS family permease
VSAKEIRVASLIAALVLLDLAVWLAVVPIIPLWERTIGLSHTQSGIVLGAYSVAVLALSIPAGHLGDRIGPRRVTIAAAFLFALTVPLFGFATSFWQLVALRAINGVFSAASWTAGLAWLMETVPDSHRSRAMTTVNAAASPASVIGPLIGGPGVQAFGLRPMLFGVAGVIVLLSIWALLEHGSTTPVAADHPSALAALRVGLGVSGIRLAYAGIMFASLSFGGLQLLGTVHLTDRGISQGGVGWVFTGGSLLSVGFAIMLARRSYDRLRIARLGVVAVSACLLYLAAVSAATPFIVGMLVMGSLSSVIWITIYPMCSAAADAAGIGQGLALGGLNTVWALFAIVGPAFAGFATQHGAERGTFIGLAGVGIAVAVVLRSRLSSPA